MRGKIVLPGLLIGLLLFSLAGAANQGGCPIGQLQFPANVAFILDASNSMNKAFDDTTRLAVAKSALVELWGLLPEGTQIRISVYGHRVAKDFRSQSCEDIEALYPFQPLTAALRDDMTQALDGISAKGLTPLADALVRVSNDLAGLDGESVIVLVSDGEETCGGDPLVVAELLADRMPKVVLHIIGLDVEADAKETLRAIAEATGGQYRAAREGAQLYSVLSAQTVAPQVEPVSIPGVVRGIPAEYACLGVTNVIYGTEGDDVLYGTAENDLVFALGGDDLVIGLGGKDFLIGGAGNDILEGGDGNDALDGGSGDDVLFGGTGDDLLCGGLGEDSLEGEEGQDCLSGGDGYDVLLGGPGENLLYDNCNDGDILLEGAVSDRPCPGCPLPGTACPVPAPLCPAPAPPCPAPVESATCLPLPCPAPVGDKSVDEGAAIQLHGTVADNDCNVVSVVWCAERGRFDDATSLHPLYTAPYTECCDGEDVLITLAATDSCGASASDSFTLHVNNVNHAPTANAGEDIVVEECERIRLTCDAYDPDGDALSILWTADRGAFDDPTLLHPTYVAPITRWCEGEDVTLTMTVADSCGASTCDTMVVHVRNRNRQPIADAGEDLILDEGQSLKLMSSAAHDPDDDDLTYRWTIECGHGSFDEPYLLHPCFFTPFTDHCTGEDLVLRLTVIDACGASASDTVTVHVRNVNHAPTADAGPDIVVDECATVQLTCSATDPDGDALSYRWTAEGGRGTFDNPTALHPCYTAPRTENCEGETVLLTLTVSDACGSCVMDTMLVHVRNLNQPPTVKADP